jgi:phosphatidylglycerophosphate synthase
MLANYFRPWWNKLIFNLGKASVTIGFNPDIWTFLSLGFAVLSALNLRNGKFWDALILAVAMLLADAMDGATARAKAAASKFGTILDHVVDRYAEFILFGGLLLGNWIPANTIIFSISGVLMASYVRAKAESVGGIENCAVGIAGRAEKLLLTYCGIALLALHQQALANYVFWAIGVISHVTVIQRIFYARSVLRDAPLLKKNIGTNSET